jgi:hypothetical protein
MAYQNVDAGFDTIGTRPSQSSPGNLEYFNTENNLAFGSPTQLSSYLNSAYGVNTDPSNVFSVLSNPRSQALNQIKDQLNQFQNDTFNAQDPSAKRASSSLTDSIAADQSAYDTSIADYKTLTEKLKALTAPDYLQEYNTLRASQGVPGLENDYAANQKNIRELPYVNRMNSGNAGVQTEGQLNADTTQKGIPLEIQQGNLLDRLKLAGDFIATSLNLKEKNFSTSQDAIKTAAGLVADTINLTRSHLSDLLTQQKEQQSRTDAAQKFAFDNRISKPFYEISGTVFRTSDRQPAHDQKEYVAMGGKGDFSDVQSLSSTGTQAVKWETVTLGTGKTARKVRYGYDAQGNIVSSIDLESGQPVKSTTSVTTSARAKTSKPVKITLAQATNYADQFLSPRRGKDGYISPEDFRAARAAWIQDGLDVNAFYSRFKKYINPADKQDY